MSDMFRRSDKKIERLERFFRKHHGSSRVDDRRLSRIAMIFDVTLPPTIIQFSVRSSGFGLLYFGR